MRLTVSKTYKLYLGGSFPRSESGRTDPFINAQGETIANVSRASRKDLRAAVEAARKAQGGWASRSAYLKGQILYRMAEMLESRATNLASELVSQGSKPQSAELEVTAAIELLVHYAGWSDKFMALSSSVNPVASSHFNFSVPEPVGTIGLIAPAQSGLLGLISLIAPAIVGGNAVVALAAADRPLSALGFAEVLATSDLPGGVVNLLTGRRDELLPHFASHRDLDALWSCGASQEERTTIQQAGSDHIKRLNFLDDKAAEPNLELILSGQEIKTTWHPIGV